MVGGRGFSAGVGPGNVVPGGARAMSGGISGVTTRGVVGAGGYWHPWVEAGDAAKLPEMHRTAPTVRGQDDLAQNVTGTEAEKCV